MQQVVIDEADFFFSSDRDYEDIVKFHTFLNPDGPDKPKKNAYYQYILFSATYKDEVKDKISTIIKEA